MPPCSILPVHSKCCTGWRAATRKAIATLGMSLRRTAPTLRYGRDTAPVTGRTSFESAVSVTPSNIQCGKRLSMPFQRHSQARMLRLTRGRGRQYFRRILRRSRRGRRMRGRGLNFEDLNRYPRVVSPVKTNNGQESAVGTIGSKLFQVARVLPGPPHTDRLSMA